MRRTDMTSGNLAILSAMVSYPVLERKTTFNSIMAYTYSSPAFSQSITVLYLRIIPFFSISAIFEVTCSSVSPVMIAISFGGIFGLLSIISSISFMVLPRLFLLFWGLIGFVYRKGGNFHK